MYIVLKLLKINNTKMASVTEKVPKQMPFYTNNRLNEE